MVREVVEVGSRYRIGRWRDYLIIFFTTFFSLSLFFRAHAADAAAWLIQRGSEVNWLEFLEPGCESQILSNQ